MGVGPLMRRRRWWRSTSCGAALQAPKICTASTQGLGADVPFALHGGTALGRGNGGELTPLEAGLFYWVLLPIPHHLSTPAVYARLDDIRGAVVPTLPKELPGPMVKALAAGEGEALAPFLENDLASAAVSLYPPILTTVLDGEEVRALWAMVSGIRTHLRDACEQ